MKKFLLIMLAAMGTLPLSAQTYDTIGSRYDSCYYTRWYDTCRSYLNGQQAELRGFETHSRINFAQGERPKVHFRGRAKAKSQPKGVTH